MTPLEASAFFATIVGLICNWKQDRSSEAADKAESFMLYLANHNFNELCGRIASSADLQRDLTELLRQDAAQLSAKLDVICGTLAQVAGKLDGFSALARPAGGEALSAQAVDVLDHFANLGATQMIHVRSHMNVHYLPGNQGLEGLDARFLDDDIALLEQLGFIRATLQTDLGVFYSLTRLGASFVSVARPG